MDDLGTQIAYLALALETPVYSSEQRQVGRVSEILAAGNDDIFDGLLVQDGFHKRYVMADSVEAIYERGVVLVISEDEFKELGPRVAS